MEFIQNPILKGFNPDPSICKVGDDYYIATSTFEWFPGVQIHYSKDLKHWKVIAQPLKRQDQLDLKGIPDSCGVWAPCLSYHNGTFYLVYSNVKSFDSQWMDTPNFVVTTQDILGEWSSPAYLNSNGFDGSFFHDKGKVWYVSMQVDHRNENPFNGILLQEFDLDLRKLVGKTYILTKGTKAGSAEGPHLYYINGYYYLIVAEGGTEYNHSTAVFRCNSLTGKYEEHPNNPILTSKDNPEHPLQKAGHASLVQTTLGKWYMVFLVGRPLSERGRCILGRETAIEEIIWRNDWPYIGSKSITPRVQIPLPDIKDLVNIPESETIRYNFDSEKLSFDFQSLRVPINENWFSLKTRKGFLRLIGKESLASTHNQSMVARRVQHFAFEATTCLDFDPRHFKHLAGLVLYYNTGHYHYLAVTHDGNNKILTVISCDNFKRKIQKENIVVTGKNKILLRASVSNENLQFGYSYEGEPFKKIGGILDMSILSDDYIQNGSDKYRPAFTGSFVGMCCQDLSGYQICADFEWFEYQEIK